MENRIRQLREKVGLSQQALAELVGTSQQQIARIETGTQSVKLDLALRIALALKSDLGRVFPGTASLVGRGKSKKSRSELVELHYDAEALQKFDSAGVDLDPATWVLQLRMRARISLAFVISTADAMRLRRNIYNPDPSTPFFIFKSSQVAVALNLNHLFHYYELWDKHTPADWHDSNVSTEQVSVYLSDSRRPLRFDVVGDEGSPDDEDDEGQLRRLLGMLELSAEPGEFINFMDMDGEHAFFRAEEIAILTIPLRDLDARLNDALLDAEYGAEDDEADSNSKDEVDPGNTRPR
jgi:transcriptional regulator with XRE-family HTH domain